VFDKVLADAEAACRKVGNIPANYKVLFLTGGATSQNFMVPANLLPDDGVAAFLTTGYWAEKTFEESKFYSSKVYEAFDGRPNKHSYCPADNEIAYKDKPVYVHMCSNNTIYGTQWRNPDGSERLPKVPDGSVLVCDASSDIFSRPIDVTRYGMIYAGAQKNIGIAGTTLAIIREDLLKPARKLPTMLRYEVHAKDGSRHNTPPVFPIYMAGLVFDWINRQGGLEAMHRRNLEKAKVLYDVLDSSRFWKAHARPDSRSLMNITFKVNPEIKDSTLLDEKLVKECQKNGMEQLQGHRSTGGVRASVYNAFPMEGARHLAQFMREFERKNG
jgi:phosphoserine aminotransferase